jgi:hypothetical protein
MAKKSNEQLTVYNVTLPDGETFSFTSSESIHVGKNIFCHDSFGESIYIQITSIDGHNLQAIPNSKNYIIHFTDGEITKVYSEMLVPGKMFVFRDYDGHDSVAMVESIDGNIIKASRIILPVATERSS